MAVITTDEHTFQHTPPAHEVSVHPDVLHFVPAVATEAHVKERHSWPVHNNPGLVPDTQQMLVRSLSRMNTLIAMKLID